MAILSDKNYVSGQPRMEGHRIWVSHVVSHINEIGLEEYVEDFDLAGEEDKIKEAIDYCRKEQCVGKAVQYCQGCNKSKNHPGEDLWKTAQNIYNSNF